jgi:hypothetical protein
LFRGLTREIAIRRVGEHQAEAVVEILEDRYGGEHLGAIRQSLETQGVDSPFFWECKSILEELRQNGGSEKNLKKGIGHFPKRPILHYVGDWRVGDSTFWSDDWEGTGTLENILPSLKLVFLFVCCISPIWQATANVMLFA